MNRMEVHRGVLLPPLDTKAWTSILSPESFLQNNDYIFYRNGYSIIIK